MNPVGVDPEQSTRTRRHMASVAAILNSLTRNGTIVIEGPSEYALAEWLGETRSTVNTTNATQTTIQTITIPSTAVFLAKVQIIGRRTGGSAGTAGDSACYIREAMVNGVKGVLTMSDVAGMTVEDQAGWDVNLSYSAGSMLVKVTGAVDNNITWTAYTRLYRG